jgi:hypothetical protein
MPQPVPCPTCADRRWVSTPTGRTRCACYWAILHDAVPVNLKHGESLPPDAPEGVTPWPLTNQVVGGDYNAFRHQVWRSLVHHQDADPNFRLQVRYLSLDALRLVEIQFQRDPEFKNVLALVSPGVLILTLGLVYQPAAGFGEQIVKNVLTLREMEGKPSWVYAAARQDLPQMAFASVFSRSNQFPIPTTLKLTASGPVPDRTGDAPPPTSPQGTRSKSAQLRDATAALKRKDAKDTTH